MSKPQLPILCVDFDGVLHSYGSGWQGATITPDPPVPGALQFLKNATKYFTVHIHSSRSHQLGGLEAMQRWLAEWIIKEEYGNADELVVLPRWFYLIHFPNFKPSAMVTLDDRAVTFNGVFPDVMDLLRFQPWHHK